MSKKEMTLTQAWEVKTTLPEEAAAIAMAKDLVESKLAACVQIAGPIRSVYRWENAIQSALEWTLSIKTLESKLKLCTTQIAKLHSYKVPEILCNPIHQVSDDYHRWLHDELTEPSHADASEDIAADLTLGQNEPWHLQIQALGSDAAKHGKVSLQTFTPQNEVTAFTFDQWSQPAGPSPLRISFEAIADQLSAWPGMYFEMDGSFVWVSTERSEDGAARWQLDGMIYDRAGTVQYVELKGRCDRNAWTKLVSVLNPDDTPIVVHLIQSSAWVLESDFRKTFL